MKIATTVRSLSAIAVGILFTVVTMWVLLEDCIRHGAPFTTKHLMAIAVLCGTVFFGHRVWCEFQGRRYGNALGCAVLFTAGTVFCVLSSAGRNAEATTAKVLQANSVNVSREIAVRDVEHAQARLNVALTTEATECAKSQYANACYTARATTEIRRQHYNDARKALSKEKPLQVADGDVRAAAELLSKLPWLGGNVESIQATLTLVFPFLLSLFCEVAAIVGFAMGLGHKLVQLPKPETLAIAWKAPRSTDEELVLQALRKAGRPLSNEELGEAMGVSAAESSKRRQVCEASGVIRTRRDGKYLLIEPAV